MAEITFRESDREVLTDVTECIREHVDYRLEVVLTDNGAIRIDGCRASLVPLVTVREDGTELRSFQVRQGGKPLGVFPEGRFTDAVAVCLSTAAVPAGTKIHRLDIGDWQQIADRLAARKASRVSA